MFEVSSPCRHAPAAGRSSAAVGLAGDGAGGADRRRHLGDGGWTVQIDRAGATALIAAVMKKRLPMVKLLIEAGADVNGYAPGDETPLINAAATGYVEIARYLIARGADVNLAVRTNHERAGKTRSPMSQATKHGHGDMIELLEASGAE